MLEKPDLDDARLVAGLSDCYGLRVDELAFLPLGADANTAVYRAAVYSGGVGDNRAYFLKLRRGPSAEMSVAIPAYLAAQGIDAIIAPIRTANRQLGCALEPFRLTLYPFVEGTDGYEATLTEGQWAAFGSALKRVHAAGLPAAFAGIVPRESYSPAWREQVRALQARVRSGPFDDPIAAEFAHLIQAKAAVVTELVEGAERLGQALLGRPQELILCHGDLHAGNLLLARDGRLYIVDWDTAVLAPKERDLMFVGSGLGPGWNQPRATEWFYQGYGPAPVDPVALAYYRCERIVQDIAAYCNEILLTTGPGPDRSQGLRYFKSQFQPGGVIEIALDSLAAAPGG